MSTFSGYVKEFPEIYIDNFTPTRHPLPLAYFLSHVHSDHTKGLETYRSPAFIYCSAVTKELLLRMEKVSKRSQFDKGILEAKEKRFRDLKRMLRPLPLNVPVNIKLNPEKELSVTLFDVGFLHPWLVSADVAKANHCPGAVMFLLEGSGRSVLYTGDIRAEEWWTDVLMRQPALTVYLAGLRRIDIIYLDTTYARKDAAYCRFTSKASGIRKLIREIHAYEPDQLFHLRSWTFGYEEVWAAIAAVFLTKIHTDRYHLELYSTASELTESIPIDQALGGFFVGSAKHDGVLSTASSRFHACQPECDEAFHARAIRVLPVVNDNLEEPAVPVKWEVSDDLAASKPTKGQIAFSFARHSSYEELCRFVKAINPLDIYPCCVDEDNWSPELSMRALFGGSCDVARFSFDEEMIARGFACEGSDLDCTQSQNSAKQLSSFDGSDAIEYIKGSLDGSEDMPQSPGVPESPQLLPTAKRPRLASTNAVTSHDQTDSTLQGVASEVETNADESQLTLSESAFMDEASQESKTSVEVGRRIQRRQEAYRAARDRNSEGWASVCEFEAIERDDEIEL